MSVPATSRSTVVVFPRKRLRAGAGGRLLLFAGLAVTVPGAFVIGSAAGAHAGDAELALLLRFMGVIKLAMAATAAALVSWRLGAPLAARLRPVAIGAVWCLAAGAVLITCLAYLVPAAALFHAGLLALLVLAVREARAERSCARDDGA